jgi:hypothetical protein
VRFHGATHPPERIYILRCSGVHTLFKLPGFGSGAVYDSKGHVFSSSARSGQDGNKQGGGLRKPPPDNSGLEMTSNCYTHFSIHASLSIFFWKIIFIERFFSSLYAKILFLAHCKKHTIKELSKKQFHHGV